MEADAAKHGSRSANDSTDGDEVEYRTRDKVIFGVTAAILSLIAAVHFGVVHAEVINVAQDDE